MLPSEIEGPFAQAALALSSAGLAVLPFGGADGKVPLVKWCHWRLRPGQAFLEELIRQHPDKNIGVICGLSGVTVVDIDEAELLSQMIERFGDTPLKTLTPSGGIHLWYRNSGEGCPGLCRAEGLAVDIKGNGGLVVVPPSVRPAGDYAGRAYRFLAGGWDNLPHLPPIRTGALRKIRSSEPAPLPAVREGRRNGVLFGLLLRHAVYCDSGAALLDVAETINSGFMPPLDASEVAKTATSAWEYENAGVNWVGKEQRVVTLKSELERLSQHENGADALMLLQYLRLAHWDRKTFGVSPKAMWRARSIGGWGHQRYRNAISALIETDFLIVVHKGGRGEGDLRLFAFSTTFVQQGTDLVPDITKNTSPPPPWDTEGQRRVSLEPAENFAQPAVLAKAVGGRR